MPAHSGRRTRSRHAYRSRSLRRRSPRAHLPPRLDPGPRDQRPSQASARGGARYHPADRLRNRAPARPRGAVRAPRPRRRVARTSGSRGDPPEPEPPLGGRRGSPAIVILLELEGRPAVRVDCLTEGERDHLPTGSGASPTSWPWSASLTNCRRRRRERRLPRRLDRHRAPGGGGVPAASRDPRRARSGDLPKRGLPPASPTSSCRSVTLKSSRTSSNGS